MVPGQKLPGGELANCNVTTRGDKSSAADFKSKTVGTQVYSSELGVMGNSLHAIPLKKLL
jgi:hypothetical protein